MDKNKPLHLVLVVLTKLHATGETPGFKKQLRPSTLLYSCKENSNPSAAEQSAGTGAVAAREKGVFSPGKASLKQF